MNAPYAPPRIEYDEAGRPIYEPDGRVLADYLFDDSHVAIIRGPIGSGTSSGSCMRIWRHAMEQYKHPVDGKRRSRWVVVRNTYSELRDTTLKTWLDWFPEERFGRVTWSRPICHEVRVGDVELDVFFLALDSPEDVAKLRSLEITGGWINEVEFHHKAIVDELESRTGRYPALKDGGARWNGVIADMNAPSEDHWVPQMMGEAAYPDDVPEDMRVFKPASWAYFVQPAAVLEIRSPDGKSVVGYRENPGAENRKWLKPGYYEEKLAGKTKRWIDSRLRNVITFVTDGEPVWAMFNPDMHVAPEELRFVPGHRVIVGLDFGRRPTAVIMQAIGSRIFVQREFRMYGASAATFAPALKRHLEQHYAGAQVEFWGDPKGQDKGQNVDTSAYDIFRAHGMIVRAAPVKNNNLETRLSAVETVLQEATGGLMRFVICPRNCPTLKAALMGKYVIKKTKEGGEEPFKDKYSDCADAMGYAFLGMGEGRKMIGLEVIGAGKGAAKVYNGRRSLRRAGR
jgi:hypothetical protein